MCTTLRRVTAEDLARCLPETPKGRRAWRDLVAEVQAGGVQCDECDSPAIAPSINACSLNAHCRACYPAFIRREIDGVKAMLAGAR